MRKLKVLKSNMETPFQNYQMELGKKYVCENFDPNPDELCSNGFYATDVEGLTYSINQHKDNRVFECEVGGQSVTINQYKQRFETIELIRELNRDEIEQLALAAEPELGYKLCEAIYPINPLIGDPKEVTEREIELLKQWIAVRYAVEASLEYSVSGIIRDSIGNSVKDPVRDIVRESVGDSVRDSIGNSIRVSVKDAVWISVQDSIWAYISSLFPNVKKWEGIDHAEGENPFQPSIDLWRSGFVPSYDGTTCRLHSGKGAKIVYEMKI